MLRSKNVDELNIMHYQGLIDHKTEISFLVDGKYVETTYGRIVVWDKVGVLPEGPLDKKGIKKLVLSIHDKYPQAIAIKKLKELQDLALDVATKKASTLSADDFKPLPGTIDTLNKTYELAKVITNDNEKAKLWDSVIESLEDEWLEKTNYSNNLREMYETGARVNRSQIRQMIIAKGLLTNMDGTLKANAINQSLSTGINCHNYFQTCGPARRGMASNFFSVPASGYLSRQLSMACRDIVISENDCGTEEGLTLPSYLCRGRVLINGIKVTKEIIKSSKVLTIRSPVTCESSKGGVCSLCCGDDPGTGFEWRESIGIGLISAQSLSEPAVQLGLSGKHTSGSVTIDSHGKSIDNVLAKIIKTLGAKGTNEIMSGKEFEYITLSTQMEKHNNLEDSALDIILELNDLYEMGGINIAIIHFEIVVRAMSDTVTMDNGEVGIRSEGDRGKVIINDIHNVPINYPSWLRSISYGHIKRRLIKAVSTAELSRGGVTEKLIIGTNINKY